MRPCTFHHAAKELGTPHQFFSVPPDGAGAVEGFSGSFQLARSRHLIFEEIHTLYTV
eukprot:jgi/Antlo1/361/693